MTPESAWKKRKRLEESEISKKGSFNYVGSLLSYSFTSLHFDYAVVVVVESIGRVRAKLASIQ